MTIFDKFSKFMDELFEDTFEGARKEFDKLPPNAATEETSIEVRPDGTRLTTIKRTWKKFP